MSRVAKIAVIKRTLWVVIFIRSFAGRRVGVEKLHVQWLDHSVSGKTRQLERRGEISRDPGVGNKKRSQAFRQGPDGTHSSSNYTGERP